MIPSFPFSTLPKIIFGPNSLQQLRSISLLDGSRNIALVYGSKSFKQSTNYQATLDMLHFRGVKILEYSVTGEPSPEMVNQAVSLFNSHTPEVVIAIGGGSVIDAGKAISAMLPSSDNVEYYLDDVGTKIHDGRKVPFIAIPTTAGTGSEVTKNAVLSIMGADGYKKSLRHENFTPNIAIVDPTLTLSCPPQTTAASGMDAFAQLLESYLSTEASPLTDMLAYEGMKHLIGAIEKAVSCGDDLEARTALSYAAMLSGITLANAGLGLGHGFAQPLGSHFGIPHGMVCGTLMAEINRVTARKLQQTNPSSIALKKYAAIGKLCTSAANQTDGYYIDALVDKLDLLIDTLGIARLSAYGITEKEFDTIIQETGHKNHPVKLDNADLANILRARL